MVVLNGESVPITTRQLLSQRRFAWAVFGQSMRSANPYRHSQAFAALQAPMSKTEWLEVVNDALVDVETVDE